VVVGVQVGAAALLRAGDHEALSGIRKRAVAGAVAVGPLGLAGDEQADLSVHGGLSKAVYACPSEHYGFWCAQRQSWGLPTELPYGSLGENLALAGVEERALFVGDILSFPACRLRVTQLRTPCWKFNAVMGHPSAARLMLESGRSGFYLSVVEPGRIAAGQEFQVLAGPREVSLESMTVAARGRRR